MIEPKPNNPPKPPTGLPAEARKWFVAMTAEYDFSDDPGGLELLRSAAWQLARMIEARKAIKADGLIVQDRFGQQKEHPAAATERSAANQFRLHCRELGIGDGSDESARLPRS